MTSPLSRPERIAALHAAAKERILVLDGSWGVMIQRRGLSEADFRADRFVAANGYDEAHQMKGNNDILCITRPDIISDLHDQYYAAGADISETNTFSGTTIAQEDYALDAQAVWDINLEGAKLARAAADRWTEKTPEKPRFAAGSIGPLNKMLSMSSDVNDPGARLVTFDQVYEAYRHQVKALNEGGVDLYLIETITDTLNCKAAIKAIKDLEDEGMDALPIWISGTITDRSGRTLSGQTAEAFWNSVRHAKPFAIGFNCALGAELMRPFIAELSRIADTLVGAVIGCEIRRILRQASAVHRIVAFDDPADGCQDLFHGRFTRYAWLSHTNPRCPQKLRPRRFSPGRFALTLGYAPLEKNHVRRMNCRDAQLCCAATKRPARGGP